MCSLLLKHEKSKLYKFYNIMIWTQNIFGVGKSNIFLTWKRGRLWLWKTFAYFLDDIKFAINFYKKGLAHRTFSEWGIAISAAIYFKIMSTLHSAILFICKKMKHFIRECLKFSSPPSPQHQWPPQPRVLVLSQVRLDSCCCSPSLV